jgi:hypothetical protein
MEHKGAIEGFRVLLGLGSRLSSGGLWRIAVCSDRDECALAQPRDCLQWLYDMSMPSFKTAKCYLTLYCATNMVFRPDLSIPRVAK